MEEILVSIMEKEGVKWDYPQQRFKVRSEIKRAIDEDKFRFIVIDGRRVGFLTWSEKIVNGKKHIFINYLVIYKKRRNPTNLLHLRSFFRDFYNKNYNFVFWRNRKKERYYYAK